MGLLIIVFFVGGFFLLNPGSNDNTRVESLDYKDVEYTIEGKRVQLTDGYAETEISSGSASKTITRYFGNEVAHDLNEDGREDIAFLLTQEKGGSGIFFYLVAALNMPNGYIGSEAFFLGDRIAPQTTRLDEGDAVEGRKRKNVIVVNYAEHAAGEPVTARPSVGKSIWLKLDLASMQFGEVSQNFEGESSAATIRSGFDE